MIPITKEVRLFLLVVGGLIAAVHYKYGVAFAWPAWLLFTMLLLLFRDFKRAVPAIPLAIVSSIDGKVVRVENVYDSSPLP